MKLTRCKDCVYAKHTFTDEYKCEALDITDGFSHVWLDADDFCSKGRRTFAEGLDNATILKKMEKESGDDE